LRAPSPRAAQQFVGILDDPYLVHASSPQFRLSELEP
jgi:hypothetical protein